MTQQIEVLKKRISDVRIKKGVKEERKKEVMHILDEDYGLKNIKQCEARLKKISPEIDKLEAKEKELINKITVKLDAYESD